MIDSCNVEPVSVGLVGYGYWGPNLARNFERQLGCRLAAICDNNGERAALAQAHFPHTKVTREFEHLLDDDDIQAVLIATPVFAHYKLTKMALEAGKDVLVEKPLAANLDEAGELVRLAEREGRILAVDHTFLYTGAVQKMREIVEEGQIGDIIYMDSVRVNLGLFQHDINVVWDLAPHDLSIFSYVGGVSPTSVQAMGHRYGSDQFESIAYVHLEFDGGSVGHCHLNWVSPVKLRQMLIGGTTKMIVYDDMEHSEKVKVHDKGIVARETAREIYNEVRVDYRTGDMWSPKVNLREALDVEAEHFLDCVRRRKTPRVDGRFGLEIVRQLVACQKSIDRGGEKVQLLP